MKYFKILLILFILVLTLFFNIEQFGFVDNSVVNIDSYVYLIGLIFVTLIIISPITVICNSYTTVIVCAVLYFLLKSYT